MLTIGSLFSGIGGMDYGFERTGKFRTIWFSEIDSYASAVLSKHWPNIPNLGDITKIDFSRVERPDILIGGFPCQDISVAGKGAGIEGARSGLWKEYFKAISILRPKYAVIENVPMLVKRGLNIVLADLAQIGYDAEWNIIPAAVAGAIHKRERIFIVAYPNRIGSQRFFKKEILRKFGEFSCWEGIRCIKDIFERSDLPKPLVCRGIDGIPNRIHRIKCLGNAVVPQVAQLVAEMILEYEKSVVNNSKGKKLG